jgi:hypothetical protein
MLKIVKLLKNWVRISKTTGRAPLNGVFANSRFMDKALKVLKGKDNSDKTIVTVCTCCCVAVAPETSCS